MAMTRAAFYPRASRTQDFSKAYKGSTIQPNVLVLHTTEGMSWPTYGGGASSPHATAKYNAKTKKLEWRQHFPFTMSARALRNESGGVETNTLNAVQVELIGTCDTKHQGDKSWLYWPDAPEEALNEVADFVAFLHTEWSLALRATPLWLPYPASYGNTKARMTDAKWRSFYGVCGHQHVPENVHGDPGDIDIKHIIATAKTLVKPAPKPKSPRANKVHAIAQEVLDGKGTKTSKARLKQWEAIRDAAQELRKD